MFYTNTIIQITEIGETDVSMPSSVVHENDALQCITDKPLCCMDGTVMFGEWYYPSGDQVDVFDPSINSNTFYQNRGPNDGTVNLNRRESNFNLTSLTSLGKFCCIIPDAKKIMKKICANLGKQPIL